MTTHYDFEEFNDEELIDFTLDPPFDLEARDWKALAKRLAVRFDVVASSLERF